MALSLSEMFSKSAETLRLLSWKHAGINLKKQTKQLTMHLTFPQPMRFIALKLFFMGVSSSQGVLIDFQVGKCVRG